MIPDNTNKLYLTSLKVFLKQVGLGLSTEMDKHPTVIQQCKSEENIGLGSGKCPLPITVPQYGCIGKSRFEQEKTSADLNLLSKKFGWSSCQNNPKVPEPVTNTEMCNFQGKAQRFATWLQLSVEMENVVGTVSLG